MLVLIHSSFRHKDIISYHLVHRSSMVVVKGNCWTEAAVVHLEELRVVVVGELGGHEVREADGARLKVVGHLVAVATAADFPVLLGLPIACSTHPVEYRSLCHQRHRVLDVIQAALLRGQRVRHSDSAQDARDLDQCIFQARGSTEKSCHRNCTSKL